MSTHAERQLVARIAAHESWANTPDRNARTAPARAALEQKFLEAAGGDLTRAEHFKKAHYARLALKSAKARRMAREARSLAAEVETELGGQPGSLLDPLGGDAA